MSRIAVLISGEYRTFELCRPSMTFLDQANVDVYFSTWDQSHQYDIVNEKMVSSDVTIDRIRAAMGSKQITNYVIDPHDLFDHSYVGNSKLLFRWHRGLHMIQSSRVHYDYIVVIRPDLYFDLTIHGYMRDLSHDPATLGSNVLHVAWETPKGRTFLNDIMFLAKPNVMYRALMNCTVQQWNADRGTDWHFWFARQVAAQMITVQHLKPIVPISFCRPNCTVKDDTFQKIHNRATQWRNVIINKERHMFTDDELRVKWGPNIIEQLNNPPTFDE